jgi:hypothetical protein
VTRLSIDFVSAEPDGSAYSVFLVHTPPWTGDGDELHAVAERLQVAINWMADGGFYARFPEADGAPVRLVFEYVHEPDAAGRDLIDRATLGAAGVGVEFVARAQPRA